MDTDVSLDPRRSPYLVPTPRGDTTGGPPKDSSRRRPSPGPHRETLRSGLPPRRIDDVPSSSVVGQGPPRLGSRPSLVVS